jgi:phage shock protein PspC (stress-responsive transcriptional regulator)
MMSRYGLFRDPARGWIAGVAAGLAERFEVSAGVIRLVIVVAALAGTPVLAGLVYAVLAVMMPVRPFLFDARRDRFGRGGY